MKKEYKRIDTRGLSAEQFSSEGIIKDFISHVRDSEWSLQDLHQIYVNKPSAYIIEYLSKFNKISESRLNESSGS